MSADSEYSLVPTQTACEYLAGWFCSGVLMLSTLHELRQHRSDLARAWRKLDRRLNQFTNAALTAA